MKKIMQNSKKLWNNLLRGKDSIRKYRLLMIAFIFAIVCLTGCGHTYHSISRDIVEHMDEKYGVEFEMYEIMDDFITRDYFPVLLSSPDFPGEKIKAEWTIDQEGNVEYADGYLTFLMREQVEAYLLEKTEAVYGECKVFQMVGQSTVKEVANDENALENLLRGEYLYVHFFVLLPPETSVEEGEKKVQELISTLNAQAAGHIFYLNNQKMYDEVTRENVRETVAKEIDHEVVFLLGREECKYLRWVK